MEKKKLLLHCCCGPCSTAVVEKIIDTYDITLFYYNPNIMPKNEYFKRFNELKKFNDLSSNRLNLIETNYNNLEFLSKIDDNLKNLPEGDRRCEICFDIRLAQTAKFAKENGFDLFGTTLTVSPYKNAEIINFTGKKLEKTYNISFLSADFKKEGGYQRSVELSKQFELYRQKYCGCRF